MLLERGKLAADRDPERLVEDLLAALPSREATLTHAVAIESRRLTVSHQDPADRFLAATALVYDLTLVTADSRLLKSRSFSVLANR